MVILRSFLRFDISENISNILKMFLDLIIKVMILDVDLILVEVIYRNFHSVTNRILLSGEYEKEGIKVITLKKSDNVCLIMKKLLLG